MKINIFDNDLLSIQEARILAENAYCAQQLLADFSQEKLDEIVDAIAEEAKKHTEVMAHLSVEETDYGRWEDKLIKNRFVTEILPQHLKNMRCVGIIDVDEQNSIMDVGVPVGVVVSLIPAASPVSTIIYSILIAIKSGNAIIISPHPRAKNTEKKLLDILIKTGENAGLPPCTVSYLDTVTKAGTEELINHKYTSMVINTGVPDMLEAGNASGKPVIYGGAGNGPAFIERTADIHQAVTDIIASKAFDNGVATAAEQSVVVDKCIEPDVRREFEAGGAYFMTEEEADRLGKLFFFKDGRVNNELSGKAAVDLARWANIDVPANTKVLISEQKFVSEDNPYSKGKLCPVLAYFVEEDWRDACEKCIELLLTERQGHTLVIHSRDTDVIKQFAIKKPVGRVLVNTPAVFGGMGATTNLFPAMTLGSGSAGQGITADNVSPMNLIYIRKVACGVRNLENLGLGIPSSQTEKSNNKANDDEYLRKLQGLLEQALASIK